MTTQATHRHDNTDDRARREAMDAANRQLLRGLSTQHGVDERVWRKAWSYSRSESMRDIFDPPTGVPLNDWMSILAGLDHWLALHGIELTPSLSTVVPDPDWHVDMETSETTGTSCHEVARCPQDQNTSRGHLPAAREDVPFTATSTTTLPTAQEPIAGAEPLTGRSDR